nr:integrase, catalytic region, zinc finger, CCHC-type, peptidase aspartic, catalytic [Tanacetum cinerariifolium]
MVWFGNDQFAHILGYGDIVQGNFTIKRVYYVEGLNHNLFSVSQLCDANLKVAIRKFTRFVRDLQGNNLLMGNHGSDLYTIALQSKDEIPEVLINFLKMIQESLQALVMNVRTDKDKTDTSLRELKLLFSPMYEKYFNAGNQHLLKSSVTSDNPQQQDTPTTLNVQPTLERIIPPTNVNAEENNNNQAEDAQFEAYEFINPFAPSRTEASESFARNFDT